MNFAYHNDVCCFISMFYTIFLLPRLLKCLFLFSHCMLFMSCACMSHSLFSCFSPSSSVLLNTKTDRHKDTTILLNTSWLPVRCNGLRQYPRKLSIKKPRFFIDCLRSLYNIFLIWLTDVIVYSIQYVLVQHGQ
jgi:hypothetical protein